MKEIFTVQVQQQNKPNVTGHWEIFDNILNVLVWKGH